MKHVPRLNEFTEKLDISNEKMSLEDAQDLEQLIPTNSSLMEKVNECRCELESFLSSQLDVSRPSQLVSSLTVTNERMNQMQTQMQQLG